MTYSDTGNGDDVVAPEGANVERPGFISDLSEIRAIAQYLHRVGATPRSLRTAAVVVRDGHYPHTLATFRLDRATGQINVRAEDGQDAALYEPTDAERHAIAIEAAAANWPEHLLCATARNLPPHLSEAVPDDLFEFRDEDGNIVMLQHRVEKDRDKRYIPYTYWSDNQWRALEPEGELPLWGLDQLKHHEIVFIHEGAKAARAVRRMVEAATPEDAARLAAHPWGEAMRHAAHLGWIGGALSPHRTDWSALFKMGVKRVIIVADNDGPGHDAVPKIARLLAAYSITVEAVRFTEEGWPKSFDLADPFPEKLFKRIGDGTSRYVGPSMSDCTLPATQATRLGTASTNARPGRPNAPPVIVRKEFADLWVQVVTPSGTMFAPKHNPMLLFNPHQFDTINRVFSHARRLSDYFEEQAYNSIVHDIAYEPGRAPGIINIDGMRKLNTHVPPRIKRWKDTSGIWEQFMAHLIPDEEDRHNLCRWLATLIAVPGMRMRFGVLMVSVMQGVGKSTLFDIVCAMVGLQNSSTPSASIIVNSDFNGWLVRKRLIAVHEIYEGGSWKAYQRLKSILTDDMLLSNEKHMATYNVRNQAHFMLGSNSERALMLEQTDRRWLVPAVTEHKHPEGDPGFWRRFHAWLAGGGYGAIAQWAEDFVMVKGHAVEPGEAAPGSRRKDQLIDDSRSPEERATLDLAEAARARGGPVVLIELEVLAWVRAAASERRGGGEIPATVIRGWLTSAGLHVCKHDDRPNIGGRKTYIAATFPLEGKNWSEIKMHHVSPDALGETEM